MNEKKMLEILDYENERVKAGLVNIQSNLADSVSINSESLGEFNQIRGDFSELVSNSKKISQDITGLSQQLQDSKEKTYKMNELVEVINGLLKVIVGISDQTNLLALNATIEAARAGESGKGFAVVAGEVKELSKETKKAAEDITEAVEEINKQSVEVKDSMEDSTKLCNDVNTIINGFTEKLNSTNSANERSIQRVSMTNDRIFMSLAKLDHVVWKVNTYLSVIKKKEVFQFVDYHNCRLGKWYYQGDGKDSFSHLRSYPELEQPHSIVHNGTRKVFDLIAQDEINYSTLDEALKEMERGSDGVFDGLDKMLNEKNSR